jgi:hypothetical protein
MVFPLLKRLVELVPRPRDAGNAFHCEASSNMKIMTAVSDKSFRWLAMLYAEMC